MTRFEQEYERSLNPEHSEVKNKCTNLIECVTRLPFLPFLLYILEFPPIFPISGRVIDLSSFIRTIYLISLNLRHYNNQFSLLIILLIFFIDNLKNDHLNVLDRTQPIRL